MTVTATHTSPRATELSTPIDRPPEGAPSSPQATEPSTPKPPTPAGAPLATGHCTFDTHTTHARDTSSPQAEDESEPILDAPAGTTTSRGQLIHGTQETDAPASSSPQANGDTPPNVATPAGSQTDDGGQGGDDAQRSAAPVVYNSVQPAIDPPTPTRASLADPTLALAADVLDDLESVRIANENRLRQLTRDETDSDGEERGFGLDATHPDVAKLTALVQMLADAEHQAVLNLNRVLRRHPLGPWVKAQKGVGEKTAARLLAVVGDPYINPQTGQPRTVSQLWAYAGHGDPARTKFRGMSQDDLFRLGNPTAKKRVWLIATAILKAGGGEEKALAVTDTHTADASLASVYYHRKRATEGRGHATECKRCGPSGSPAQPGTPWSDAHRHADALRIVGKEFLRQLWLESKRIHDGAP